MKVMSSCPQFTDPVNLGNPIEVNILELAKLIIFMTRSKSKIIFKPHPQDEPTRRMPNINLEIGIERTKSYFLIFFKNSCICLIG